MPDDSKERIDYDDEELADCRFALDQTLNYCKERAKQTPPEALERSSKRKLGNGLTRLTLTFKAC